MFAGDTGRQQCLRPNTRLCQHCLERKKPHLKLYQTLAELICSSHCRAGSRKSSCRCRAGMKSLEFFICADSRGTDKCVHWIYGGHLKQDILFPFWTEPGAPELSQLRQLGPWMALPFLVATLSQRCCRYSSDRPSTALEERESGRVKERRE